MSFVYCTIYQQDIWREGDEKLVAEQKRTWRKFFSLIDNSYSTIITKFDLGQQNPGQQQRQGLVSKFDSLDLSSCWNSKVHGAFVSIDQIVSNPKIIACKVYRKIQPYISTPAKIDNTEKPAEIKKTDM